jgi:hypothetical protein
MGKRICPLCFVRVPWTAALVKSSEIVCPGCHAPLELSRFTRLSGSFAGIAAAFVAVHLIRGIFHPCPWVLPIFTAILTFGLASALGVLIAGDLVVRAKDNSTGFPHHSK